MKTEKLKISKLKNNSGQIAGVKKNPRIQDDAKFQKLKKSLQDFPEMLELRELVVYPLNGDYIVVGGNMRLKALKELGEKEAVCKVLPDNFPPEKINEFIIKDNVSFGLWDGAELSEWDAELLNEWGYEVPEWELPKEAEAVEDNYEIPNEIKTDVVLGDLITFEKNGKELHRLMCGDSTNSDSVAKLMNEEKADMVFTDPPYNVNYGADTDHPSWGNKKNDRTIKNDKMSAAAFRDFIAAAFANVKLFCDGVIYCFGAQGVDGRIMFTVLDEMFHCSGTIIWVKDSLVLGRGKYHTKYEPCWFGWNKSGATFTDDRTLTNVWECNRPKVSELHPTMKPIELIEMPLNHNPKAKSVLDLFLGSGSTMVAAHQLNRKCYGMELDEKYCQVIIDRMKKLDSELTVKINGVVYE